MNVTELREMLQELEEAGYGTMQCIVPDGSQTGTAFEIRIERLPKFPIFAAPYTELKPDYFHFVVVFTPAMPGKSVNQFIMNPRR